jgi:hypothetical protein
MSAVKLNNAGASKINQTSLMPSLDSALNGWGMPHTITKVTQDILDGDAVLTKVTIEFLGVIQPLNAEELLLKPEGQRSWEWKQIHDYYGILNLHTKDVIEIESISYKVLAVKDYKYNNYMEYHIVKDYVEYGT